MSKSINLNKIQIIKSDKRGIIYDCDDGVGYIVRKKGTISANHTHIEPETLYLVKGKIELTVGNQIKKVEAPIKIDINSNVYHKLIALSDIVIVRK
jgi:quercetin dioxygenase-like cupin family protein